MAQEVEQLRRPTRFPIRWAATVLISAAAAGIGGGVLLHALRSTAGGLALPALHGQVSWPAGTRPAPPIALRDQNGAPVSLQSLRGSPVLLTFLDSRCRSECPIEGRQLSWVLGRLRPADRPTLVVVSVDPKGDTRASIQRALKEWRLTGHWRLHWLIGTDSRLAPVWRSYGIAVDPRSGDIVHSLALYLIDRHGYERTGYLFPFLPEFVRSDLSVLGQERA